MRPNIESTHGRLFPPFMSKPVEAFSTEPLSPDSMNARNKREQAFMVWRAAEQIPQLRHSRRASDMLDDIQNILSASPSLDKVLEYIAAQTEPLLDATASAIYCLDHDTESLVLQSSWERPVSFSAFDTIHLKEKPWLKKALSENQPVVISSLVRDPINMDVSSRLWRHQLLASGCCTTLIVPLTVYEDIYGTLFLYYVDVFDFAEADLTMVMSFGRKAAVGIEKALDERVKG